MKVCIRQCYQWCDVAEGWHFAI